MLDNSITSSKMDSKIVYLAYFYAMWFQMIKPEGLDQTFKCNTYATQKVG